MLQNTPSSGDNELFSPHIVRLMASPDTISKIDQRLFPLDPQAINDMSQYLGTVNAIIRSGGIKEISLHELSLIQAFIRGNNNPVEIIRIEKEYNISIVLWLHFYLELINQDQREKDIQDSLDGTEADHTNLSPEIQARMLAKLSGQFDTLDRVNELLSKHK